MCGHPWIKFSEIGILETLFQLAAAAADQFILTVDSPAVRIQCLNREILSFISLVLMRESIIFSAPLGEPKKGPIYASSRLGFLCSSYNCLIFDTDHVRKVSILQVFLLNNVAH